MLKIKNKNKKRDKLYSNGKKREEEKFDNCCTHNSFRSRSVKAEIKTKRLISAKRLNHILTFGLMWGHSNSNLFREDFVEDLV